MFQKIIKVPTFFTCKDVDFIYQSPNFEKSTHTRLDVFTVYSGGKKNLYVYDDENSNCEQNCYSTPYIQHERVRNLKRKVFR